MSTPSDPKRSDPAPPIGSAAPDPPPARPAPLVRRDGRGRLLPGSANLNPGGRPVGKIAEFRKILHQLTDGGRTVAERLVSDATDPLLEPRDRHEASKIVLSYLVGKPESHVNVDLEHGPRRRAYDLSRLSDAQRQVLGTIVQVAALPDESD